MEPERPGEAPQPDTAPWLMLGWKASFLIGAASAILGLIVAFHPTVSLNVIAALLGVLMIFSGIFHIVEAFDDDERGRTWRVIAGVLFIVGGVILIRHLDLTLALIGLVIGAVWIIQGALALVAGISVGRGGPGGWIALLFGVISLVAGIVVVSTPVGSVTALAVLLGIWFVVMGVLEMAGALTVRRTRPAGTGRVNVPGQRPGESAATDSVPGGSSATGRKVQG